VLFNLNVAALDFKYVTKDELLQKSDIISLHAPLLPTTYHMLNREAFAKMKRGVMIINTSRGPLIDTEALLDALVSGQVSAAGKFEKIQICLYSMCASLCREREK
jgi:lactate dehydrogenase-like 2-hydroxyacid dehydrogenase